LPSRSDFSILGTRRAAALESCSPHERGSYTRHISYTVRLAARHLQLFLDAVFGAASWAEPSQTDRVCVTRMASAYAWGCWVLPRERRGVRKRSLTPGPYLHALSTHLQARGDLCKGLNLQIPARACSGKFICIHLHYNTDFPYQ